MGETFRIQQPFLSFILYSVLPDQRWTTLGLETRIWEAFSTTREIVSHEIDVCVGFYERIKM